MKTFNPMKVLVVILAGMLLLAGCNSAKLAQSAPDVENQLSNGKVSVADGNSKIEGTVQISNNISPEKTALPEQGSTTGPEQQAASGEDKKENTKPEVKALYLTGWTAGSTARVDHFVELANNTEINSYVIDIKDDDGLVGYESQVPEVKANGTWKKKYNPEKVLKSFHDNNIYIIGRLVAFKDPVYSIKRPDLAIKNTSGGLWKDDKKKSWLNPYNKDNWAYLVSIAKEAVELGFDEIQFDYVRFPSDGKKNMDFSGVDKEKYQAINDFLAYAASEIPDVPISADVFGIIFESPADTEKIGQYLEQVGKGIDYISPMVYPSHYAYGQIVNKITFPAPDLDPYGVVYNTLAKGRDRLSQVADYKADIRPYLQDFTASWLQPKNGQKMYQEYGTEEVKEQIKAVYDAGYKEWILWDPSNTYHEDAFLKE